ncbi:uncharacterized protein LOC142977938 [Anticarsia gemmatalis]|uniref:uncharacterized protein LOC142977938 n=1 Tax=Anticarsia gemmatalis TaxID=129554 RepID=UPI003F766BD8
MTTEQKFNCIFCKDVFDSKEDLQVHFRKHADPKFKSNSRFNVDPQVSKKTKEKSDMVSCDVCSQMFPTISKAITHKHKVHPDHDAKYFCPWCGKLFTMKHPYNIHIQTSHEKQEQIEDKIFHCDCCDVDFLLPSAMVYHNKFFHRQDTDIPDVGISKKLKVYNQEIIQLHYCAFCGEEYENKVNLFKHITDDHSDENQSPEEVLKCPLCEAIFYHLDAYEIHLSFHSTEDLYSAQNDLFAELLDFSLETVPPMVEKVEGKEDLEAESQSQDVDAETTGNALGIEKFLELAMDQAEDSNSGRVKKKKHKKSKKSAITLDEFLSMNKDVFGEGLDFQGVEEVPTQVVAKQFKTSKKIANTIASAELEKLKQKGIVVMKVASPRPSKVNQKRIMNKAIQKRELKTSSEVLTKLMNQSNNQIKIVKTSKPSVTKNEDAAENATEEEMLDQDVNICEKEGKEDIGEVLDNKCNDEKDNVSNKPDDMETDGNNKDLPTTKTDTISTPTTNLAEVSDEIPDVVPNETHIDDDITEADTSTLNSSNETEQIVAQSDKPCVHEDEKKSSESKVPDSQLVEAVEDTNNSDVGESDSEIVDKDAVDTNDIDIEDSNKHSDEIEPHKVSPVVSSLSTLKHLSHLTVKPINKNPPQLIKNNTVSKTEDSLTSNYEEPLQPINSIDVESSARPKITVDKDPTLDALKGLSKNITIKSLTPSKKIVDNTESENETDTPIQKTNSNVKLKDVTANTNLTVKKIKVENSEPVPANKPVKFANNTIKNTPPRKIINRTNTSTLDMKSNSNCSETNANTPSKTNILRHLPNITTKPIVSNKNMLPKIVKQTNTSSKIVETSQKIEEIIEISDIDDSDEEVANDNRPSEPKQDTIKSINPLQNLSKHITIKSLNQSVQAEPKIKVEKVEEPVESNDDDAPHLDAQDSDEDIISNIKPCSQKLSSRNIAFKNALKNLGKNITVKSRTSSPSQSVKSQDNTSQDSNAGKYDSADESDSEIGKVKITEIDANNCDDDDEEHNDNCDAEPVDIEPVVESPHDSASDNDEPDNDVLDFETRIQATAVQRTNQEITNNKNTICLNNLKNISKSLTIKSLNSASSDKIDKCKSQSNDNLEVTKNQGKQMTKESPVRNAPTIKNFQKLGKVVDHSANESTNQKVSVNKEVTVKTFQTKTVIQEITTTVTKTIKTVNQTVKQEVRHSNHGNIPVLPQKVLGMRPGTSKNLQGVVIRHATPLPCKPNNVVSQIRPIGTVVRPSKQIVPIRPGLNVTRPPRLPSIKTNLPKSSPNKQPIGKPLKFSPLAMSSSIAKRPNTEEGPFSCFKKPKESLIPVSDVPSFGGDSTVQVSAASHSSTNYTSTSKIIKGNSVVTATQTKSEVTSVQQMNRLGNSVGIKVKNAQFKQTQVQESSESNSMKRTTLEAIEKLQKQGLLVKKPRFEVNDNSDTEQPENNVDYSSTEEQEEA